MILVRHSVPQLVPGIDCMNWRLSSEGRIRSQALADRLRQLNPDAVYSSPEPKALETAEIVAVALKLDVAVIEDLREHDRTGVPFFTEAGEFEANVRRLFADPDRRVFGTESAAKALARFREGVTRALARGDEQPLLVTHGTVMSLYIAEQTGLDAVSIWQELSMPSYVVLDGAGAESWRVVQDWGS